MEFFGYILLAIVILLVMIMIHELGHYTAGKIFKFKINEFSVGFGPKLLQKSLKNGEKFTLRAIPLGGYCAFEGENEEGEIPEQSFINEKPWKRIIVLASGAIFNILSAVIFSFIFILAVGYQSPVVTSVSVNPETDLPYNVLLEGDVITAVDGREINVMMSLSETLDKIGKDVKPGDKVKFTILRGGVTQEVDVERQMIAPSYTGFGFEYSSEPDGAKVQTVLKDSAGNAYSDKFAEGDLITKVNGAAVTAEQTIAELTKGIGLSEDVAFTLTRAGSEITVTASKKRIMLAAYEGYGFSHGSEVKSAGVADAFIYAIPFTGKMSWLILGSFGDLVTGGIAVTEMAGPVGTVTQIAELGQTNWRNIFILLPLLASNLAIFNLLPIPALDGARIVFTAIEWIRRKPINRKVENMIHFIGMAVLLLFVVVIDIIGFFMRAGTPAAIFRL